MEIELVERVGVEHIGIDSDIGMELGLRSSWSWSWDGVGVGVGEAGVVNHTPLPAPSQI